MSIEFRKRGIGEYLEIMWRRKLTILLPTLAVGIAVCFVVSKLPSLYESKASLKINPPAISDRAVQSLSEEDISQRLTAISTEAQSRTNLEPMIAKFGLFERERANGVPTELLIEQMKKYIGFEIVTKTETQKATNFSVSYRDRDPNKARAVTAELASKYIKEQQETSIMSSRETRDFFEKQLAEVKTKLDAIENSRLAYMLQNIDKLPSQTAGLIAQLEGLRGQEKTLETEIGRIRDNRTYLEREKNNIREYSEKEASQQQILQSDVRRTPVYAELVKKRTDLKAQLDNLLTQYRPVHPDVVAKKNEITQVEVAIKELEVQSKEGGEELRKSTESSTDLRIKNYENEQQRLDSEVVRQSQNLEQVRLQIGDIQRRIESVPTAEVALSSFDRDYQTVKQNYDDLLKKKNDADLEAGRTLQNKGESISLVDSANTPQSPVNASKRYALMGVGAGIGLAIGLLLALLLELPHFFTINSLSDVTHYTNLPVLAAVPELLTAREARWQREVRFFKLIAGIVVAAVSVPILIVTLQITHIFDRFVA